MVHLNANLGLALTLSAGALLVSAAPAPEAAPMPTAAPNLEEVRAKLAKRDSCTFTDASEASASQTECSTIVLDNIAVPSGTTLDLTDLEDGTSVIFSGETTFGYEEWSGPLISISGSDITVSGTDDHVINGGGEQWWDGEGSNGGVTKPKFFYLHDVDGGSVTGLNIKNTPVQCFSIDGSSSLTISDVTIDDSDGDDGDLGHNTDAFDIGESSDITISGATVKNQDDCVAINSGTGITFTGGSCSGGHGLSIGSVGGRDDNTVETVLFESSTVSNSENGLRIKTIYDATGSVSGVTWKDITLEDITDYGIVIEQDYENGSPTGTPTDGVPITGLTVSGVTGTVADDATPIYILCADDACSDWSWDVDISGGSSFEDCEGVPDGVSC